MDKLTKSQYIALAQFRHGLRQFLNFSEEAANAEGLAPQQHQLLLSIKGSQGKDWLNIKEIAQHLMLRHHSAVELVNRTEAKGLVVRSHDPTDRRTVQVRVTKDGEEVLDRLTLRHLQELSALAKLFHSVPFSQSVSSL